MKRAAALAVVAAGTVGGFFLSGGLESLVHETDLRRDLPPCFEIGAPFHHRFRANCVDVERTPRGTITFAVNEDRLRDAPRKRILAVPKRILVVGDSFVEGWWLPEAETLPAVLASKFRGFYFINAGLRSNGPLQEASRLPELLRTYSPAGVIWILNETDAADDRFACALLEDPGAPAEEMRFGTDDFALEGWRNRVAEMLGDSQPGRLFRRRLYTESWERLAHGARASRCAECRGVDEFLRVARDVSVPVLPLFIPAGASMALRLYGEEQMVRTRLESCLARKRMTLKGPSNPSPEELRNFYWEGDFHPNPEGVVYLVDRMAPEVGAWLGRIGNPPSLAGRDKP